MAFPNWKFYLSFPTGPQTIHSDILPWTMLLEGAVPPLSNGEVPAVPSARHSSSRAGSRAHNCNGKWGLAMASGHPLTWGGVVHLTQDCSLRPRRPWKLCSGSVQQTQKLMIGLKNLKTKPFYLFLLLYPHHMHSPKSDIFPHKFFTCFSWKALIVPLYYSWGSKKHMQRAEGREPGRTHGRPCMVPAWPSLLALTGGMLMPCNLPPQLEGKRGI